jgi:hypothetical protein
VDWAPSAPSESAFHPGPNSDAAGSAAARSASVGPDWVIEVSAGRTVVGTTVVGASVVGAAVEFVTTTLLDVVEVTGVDVVDGAELAMR